MGNHKSTEIFYTDKANELLKTMPDFIKSYIRAIHNRTAPRTRYEYLKDIQNLLDYIKDIKQLASVSLNDLQTLTKTEFEEYFEYLEHYEKDGKELTNSRESIKRKMSALRKFFDYLFKSELITSDEIRKVELPKLHKKEIIYLENNEAIDFLDAVEKGDKLSKKEMDYHKKQATRDLAICYLLLSTGIRVSECAELDIDDIDMTNACVRIVRKGGDEATVYFSDEAAGYIQSYLEERKHMNGVPDTEKALFISSQKKRMSIRSIEMLIKKYAQRSVPMKHITPHKLRSTYATTLYEQTGDIYLVAETLGHKDVSTTKEHYANLSNKRKEESRNKVQFKR